MQKINDTEFFIDWEIVPAKYVDKRIDQKGWNILPFQQVAEFIPPFLNLSWLSSIYFGFRDYFVELLQHSLIVKEVRRCQDAAIKDPIKGKMFYDPDSSRSCLTFESENMGQV